MEQPAAAPAPDAPLVPDAADAAGTSAPVVDGTSDLAQAQADLGLSFRLEDVDEAYRSDVERYVKLTHGGFTRKTQELAEQRRALEERVAILDRLESDDTRDEALTELLDRLGLEFATDGEPEVPTGTSAAPESTAPTVDLSPLEQRLAAIEAKEAASNQAEYVAEVEDRIAVGLDSVAQKMGVDELPQHHQDTILALVRQLPPIDGKWPDMDGAIARFNELEAAVVEGYLKTKRVTSPDASGATGEPTFDHKNEGSRLSKINEILGRHLS